MSHCADVIAVIAPTSCFLGLLLSFSSFPRPGRIAGAQPTGSTAHLTATRRTSNHHSLRGTGGAFFLKEPEHRAGGRPAALRSVPWQRHHRGPWAPAFAGKTKGA